MEQSEIESEIKNLNRVLNRIIPLTAALGLMLSIETCRRHIQVDDLDRKITAIERSHWSSKSVERDRLQDEVTAADTQLTFGMRIGDYRTTATAFPLPLPRCYPCPTVRGK